MVIEPKYKQLHMFSDGFTPASKAVTECGVNGGAFGLIDEDENTASPLSMTTSISCMTSGFGRKRMVFGG